MAAKKAVAICNEAVADIPDGAIILIGDFAGSGSTPYYLIQASLMQGAKNLIIASGE